MLQAIVTGACNGPPLKVLKLAPVTVPAAVPLLDHSRKPLVGSNSEKYSLPPIAVRCCGTSPPPDAFSEGDIVVTPPVARLMSQSWLPRAASLAAKKSLPPRATSVDVGEHDGAGGGAVALPELDAVARVVGGEVELAVHRHRCRRDDVAAGEVDAGEQGGDGGGAIAAPLTSLFGEKPGNES